MSSCYLRVTLFLFIFTIFGVPRAHARTWDVAVTIGREIDFLSSNGTLTGRLTNPSAVFLTAIAYDSETRELYLGDTRNKNTSIFSKSLRDDTKNWTSLITNPNSTYITGMIFDPVTSSLFYIDSKHSLIMKLRSKSQKMNKSNQDFESISDKIPEESLEVIVKLPNQSPRGISLDFCNRRLYWTNSNSSSPSIESSDLSGNDRRIIINSNLYEPLAVAVDHSAGKLYWIDDEEGIHYKIERSNLDGSMRELLVHGKHQTPFHLALDNSAVYWTDWAHSSIWRLSKTPRPGDEPENWKSFFNSHKDADPTSLITRDNLEPIDCIAVERMRKLKGDIDQKEAEMYDGMTTSTEDVDEKNKEEMFCLNGGDLKNTNTSCNCQGGYEGQHCETSVCHNYCVHGECRVDYGGKPHCKCSSMYRGNRCEQDICAKFCLNEGECSIRNGEPFCSCKGSRGVRCEETMGGIDEICGILCSSQVETFGSFDRVICRCSEKNATDKSQCNIYPYGVENKTLVIIFSVIISVLITSIIVLSYFVNKFRRRPRIKKRFVVSKNGITPLTSRPQLPGDQCEIMIENCCNMNICETPCFEPNLRSPEPRMSKKEEKNSLLLDMDGNNSC